MTFNVILYNVFGFWISNIKMKDEMYFHHFQQEIKETEQSAIAESIVYKWKILI